VPHGLPGAFAALLVPSALSLLTAQAKAGPALPG